MFKPRLRIPRRVGAARLSLAAPCPLPSSPIVVPATQQHQQRSLHALPERKRYDIAPLTEDFRFERHGVPGLMSPDGFNAAYTTYQDWVLSKLDEMTTGTPFEGKTPLETLTATSREPHLAAIFNYASMAYNNHFFFDGLSKTGGEDTGEHMSNGLQESLEKSFGSLESLRREFVMTADAMFGPGFVWLVQQLDAVGAMARPFKVLTTYQAGSPISAAHWRSQGIDMNNHGGQSEAGDAVRDYFDKQNVANWRPALHASGRADLSKLTRQPPGWSNVIPVLCVNTWEHVWMWDYGIGGKINFLSSWWNTINWGKVEALSKISDKPKLMTQKPMIGSHAFGMGP